MKLLSMFTSFVKDAAKAAKRISLQEFKEVADETLTELLDIPTMAVRMYAIRREGKHEVLHLWCAHREEIALCTHCGSLSTKLHQEEHRCIRHLDVWGKKTFLHFLSRRFKCENCGRTFAEELPCEIWDVRVKYGTFVQDVHKFKLMSSISCFFPADIIRGTQEFVTPGYFETSAPE